MKPDSFKEAWEAYRTQELRAVTPILAHLGYELDEAQPHISGERYLMQAVTTTSGKKLILLGRRQNDGARVVIKVTSDMHGMEELQHERECRQILHTINFAYQVFHSPAEFFFGECDGHLISIQEFIEQKSTFLARPLKEQFALALKAFKAQEGAHATTYGHERLITKVFGTMDVKGYLAAFEDFRASILRESPNEAVLHNILGEASKQLARGRETVEQYCGFLTHTDFVPHNIRVKDEEIYLLDHSSLRFGNKHEGWARFINFMTLYNPPLAEALIEYVRLNRTPEESLSLKLIRLYRLGEIMWYYANTLSKSAGDLSILNQARVQFWARVLESVLYDRPLAPSVLEEYRRTRDALRSAEEALRQKDLH